MSAEVGNKALDVAPGSVVQVRDEEWLVTAVTATADGQLLTVRGLSELVRDTTATFLRVARHDHRRRSVADDRRRRRVVVVVLDLDEATGQDLKDDGWRVVAPRVDAIVEARSAREGAR